MLLVHTSCHQVTAHISIIDYRLSSIPSMYNKLISSSNIYMYVFVFMQHVHIKMDAYPEGLIPVFYLVKIKIVPFYSVLFNHVCLLNHVIFL